MSERDRILNVILDTWVGHRNAPTAVRMTAERIADALVAASAAREPEGAPGETPPDLERDRLWCRAIVESGLTPWQIHQVTARFAALRSAVPPAAPPDPDGGTDSPA